MSADGLSGVFPDLGPAHPAPSFSLCGAAGAAGLVKDSTSQTTEGEGGQLEFVLVTRDELRLHRMARSVRQACKAHAAATDAPAAMFTLTCKRGRKPTAKDVSTFIDHLRKWCLRKVKLRNFRYVWVAELQGDRAAKGDPGAVHYHCVVWLTAELKRRGNALANPLNLAKSAARVLPKPDVKGWWKLGSTERDWVRCKVSTYLAKYVSKNEDAGSFPRGLRTHAAGGFDANGRIFRAHHMLPKWIRDQVTPDMRCKRAVGGGFFSPVTGDHFASPWFVIASGRTVKLVKRTAENAVRCAEIFAEQVNNWIEGPGRSRLPAGLVAPR